MLHYSRRYRRAAGVTAAALLTGLIAVGCGSDSEIEPLPQTASFRGQQLVFGSVAAFDADLQRTVRILHVQPSAAPGGDGSFESPYQEIGPALAAATAGDIIYVRSGGAAATLPGFTVPVGVRLFSDAVPQVIRTTAVSGGTTLPESGTGVRPTVNGTITLSSGTTVRGFEVIPTSGGGIEGRQVAGQIVVEQNVVRGAGTNSSGILVSNTAGTATVRVADNNVSGGKDSGIQLKTDGTAQITATVENNTANENTGSGIFFYLFRGRLTATVRNNTVNQNRAIVPQESGIRFGVFNDAIGNATITGNTARNNSGNGIFVASQGTSQLTGSIRSNTASGNNGNGIFFGANEDASANGTVAENTTDSNTVNASFAPFPTGSGIFVGSQVNGRTEAVVEDNISRSNGDLGIFCFVANNAKETVTVRDNISSANTRSGIEVNAGLNGGPGNPAAPGDAPEATAVVTGNTVQNNLGIGPPLGGGGIFVLGFNRATVRTTIENNQVNNNATGSGAFGGVAIVGVQNARHFSLVRSNVLTGNGGSNAGFTALSGVPPTVFGGRLAGPAEINLRLTGNTSTNGFALVRPGGTTIRADFSGNTGAVVQPALPVEPLGGVQVP